MLTLAGMLPSPFVRKVCVVLDEKRIDYTMRVDAPSFPDTRIPGFNPLGKIPVLLIGESRTLFDSPVIVEYLDGLKDAPRLIPREFDARIDVKRWEALGDGVCDATVAIVAEGRRAESERSPSFVEKQRGKIERGIAEMARVLGDREFCCGDAMTLADICAGVTLAYVEYRVPEVKWRESHPGLARFADAMDRRSSFRATRNDPSRKQPDPPAG